MIAIDWNPDESKLRQFGWISLGGFTFLGIIIGLKFGHFSTHSYAVPAVLWTIGLASALLALTKAQWLRPLYMVLMGFSAVVGPIMATIVLGLIFFLVFTPVSLLFRLIGRDELHRRIDHAAITYWATPAAPQPASRYFRQY